VLVFILLVILIFRSFRELLRAIYFAIKPNIISIFQNRFLEDFRYTNKLVLLLFLQFLSIAFHVIIFY